LEEIRRVTHLFSRAGIDVLAPSLASVANQEDGFVRFEGEERDDPRVIELRYLHHLKRLGKTGFSYFVNPGGEIGRSASYELGVAQALNVRCFFLAPLVDHPAFVSRAQVWSPELLAEFVAERRELPPPTLSTDERGLQRMWDRLLVPGSVVAVGGVIVRERQGMTETLLVKTHKWGHRWSMVGGKVRRNERLLQALAREVGEETGLRGRAEEHLCTFDQIKNSGYHDKSISHVFVDYVFKTEGSRVRLNEEAQEFVWVPPEIALRDLEIEPNAKHTLEAYVATR
jgi:ADP-ribose pyrophosphatase YjhB (NUDIX family)